MTELRLKIDASSKACVECDLELLHLLPDFTELLLECGDILVNSRCRGR